MRKRLAKPYLRAVFALLAALLFLPMVIKGNQPRVQSLSQLGKADVAFIRQLAPEAQRLGKAYGVRPSVLLAQAALETDYGRSLLGAKYKNLYGLPLAKGQGVTVLVTGTDKAKVKSETYQVYSSWEDCLADYLIRLKAGDLGNKSLYTDLVHAKTLDQATKALVTGGFREDQAYASQILSLIKEQKLEQYDK